jgi:hypothetical protein
MAVITSHWDHLHRVGKRNTTEEDGPPRLDCDSNPSVNDGRPGINRRLVSSQAR